MNEIPVDMIASETSVEAGLAAMQRIHGRHLTDMSAEEQAQAREHWRAQVEEILESVRDSHARAGEEGGRAVLVFADSGPEEIDLSVTFTPDLRDLPDGDVEGTPAQLLALSALEAIAEPEE